MKDGEEDIDSWENGLSYLIGGQKTWLIKPA